MDRKRILIVDDDSKIRNSLGEIFQLKGYSVDLASTAMEGLEKAKGNLYNLALLDIKLPDMDGTDLVVEMHRLKPGMMKVMLTGYATFDNAITCLDRGADAYILKPVNPDKLLDAIVEKLKEQEEAEKLSEEKVAKWLESRLSKL